ncbi:MAG: nucleoside hydrolase-like domain-containing protein [Bacteroidota bacterium]
MKTLNLNIWMTCCLISVALLRWEPIQANPRVFIFTDINIDKGDPDDRQSLIHLFWYANELQIEGIVPDRWEAEGYQACSLVIDAYRRDYRSYKFGKKGYPSAQRLKKSIARDSSHASKLFTKAVSDSTQPLYILVWGNLKLCSKLLNQYDGPIKHIRLITIATGLMMEKDIPHMPKAWPKTIPCEQLNWNGFGRPEIYNNPRFDSLWWLEMNWTYSGMFTGEEPKEMFDKLIPYGSLGQHMQEVVKTKAWAQYFRVGDTPSVLYVIDDNHNINDPTTSSWAGKFMRPFPIKRPHYFTDFFGDIPWDYHAPCSHWNKHEEAQKAAMQTLENRREDMYQALLQKLDTLYGN